jgi:hypothetical protein
MARSPTVSPLATVSPFAASASQGVRESESVTRVTETALCKREDLGRLDREHEDLLWEYPVLIVVVEAAVADQVSPSSVPLPGPCRGRRVSVSSSVT